MFKGRVEKGILKTLDLVALRTFVRKFNDGTLLDIAIAKYREKRSTGKDSQNHHLNGHVQQMCQQPPFIGWDFDDVKVLVKAKAVALGFPPPTEIVDSAGTIYRRFKSEAKCDTLECFYLIEGAHLLAGEHGIGLVEENWNEAGRELPARGGENV